MDPCTYRTRALLISECLIQMVCFIQGINLIGTSDTSEIKWWPKGNYTLSIFTIAEIIASWRVVVSSERVALMVYELSARVNSARMMRYALNIRFQFCRYAIYVILCRLSLVDAEVDESSRKYFHRLLKFLEHLFCPISTDTTLTLEMPRIITWQLMATGFNSKATLADKWVNVMTLSAVS